MRAVKSSEHSFKTLVNSAVAEGSFVTESPRSAPSFLSDGQAVAIHPCYTGALLFTPPTIFSMAFNVMRDVDLLPSLEVRRLWNDLQKGNNHMGMSFINLIGFVMLVLALLFNEAFLLMNAWYDLNMLAITLGVVYLVVGASLSLWPSLQDQRV